MSYIQFTEQKTPMPDEFKAVVSKAARDYFPRKRELRDIGQFMINHDEALTAAISLEFPDCNVVGEQVGNEMRFNIDLSTGETGYAVIVLPMTVEGGVTYLGGVK